MLSAEDGVGARCVTRRRRVLVVQYAGDYRDTFYRLAPGGGETYFAQRYSDAFIAGLVSASCSVMVIALITNERYREALPNGVEAVGFGSVGNDEEEAALVVAKEFDPTHMLLRAPLMGFMRWGIAGDFSVSLTLADSFNTTGLQAWWRRRRLASTLNHPKIRWIGNHGVSASRSLTRMGVAPDKVIPWDWPHQRNPSQLGPKPSVSPNKEWALIYVGSLAELKGVGDLLRGLALLVDERRAVRQSVVGGGDLEAFKALAVKLHIIQYVTFVGPVANDEVVTLMRQADAVVIPSRTAYPEGLPLTIYEALSSRTPIIASDHPMFRRHLRDGETAMTFRSGDAAALARAVSRLMSSPSLYASLSTVAEQTWQSLQLPVTWGEFLVASLRDEDEGERWLRANSLAHGRYVA
jgi:glycosyltransferase involved in cell wall biosynthesis